MFGKAANIAVSYKHTLMVAFVLILIGFLFYWFQYRPQNIRSFCGDKESKKLSEYSKQGGFNDLFLKDRPTTAQKIYDLNYQRCLNQHGIEK